MTSEEFMKETARTEDTNVVVNNPRLVFTAKKQSQLLHAALGCGTESGELLDIVKRALFYTDPNGEWKYIDHTHVLEECGDILWYVALALRTIDRTFSDAFEFNIAKLKARYPEKFDTVRATSRDTAAEIKAGTQSLTKGSNL